MSEQTTNPDLTFLIGFDSGETYVYKAHQANSMSAVQEHWLSRFPAGDGWACDQFPARFGKPLGWRASLEIAPGTSPEFGEALEEIQRTLCERIPGARCMTARAVFFPIGIAVLVLELSVGEGQEAARDLWRSVRLEIKPFYNRIIAEAAARYLACLEQAQPKAEQDAEQYTLARLKPLSRRSDIRQAGTLFPIFFVDPRTFARARRRSASDEKTQIADYEGSAICVNWSEALVQISKRDHRQAIQDLFLIALTSWYALRVMDKLLSSYLLDAFVGVVSKRHRTIEADESRVRRLAYMDAANAAHPVRWTITERDLRLLECIHESWRSDRWWKNVEERTALLALHHQQLQAEEAERQAAEQERQAREQTQEQERQAREQERLALEHERRIGRIGVLGVVIAVFTLSSAVSDVAALVREGHMWSLRLALGIPALITIPLIWFALRKIPQAR